MTAEPFPPVESVPANDKPGLGIASLVLGIISLCGSWVPFANYCLTLFVLGGIVTGILGLKSSKKGLAIAGLVLSILALCAVIGSIILWSSIDASQFMDPSQWENLMNQMNY